MDLMWMSQFGALTENGLDGLHLKAVVKYQYPHIDIRLTVRF